VQHHLGTFYRSHENCRFEKSPQHNLHVCAIVQLIQGGRFSQSSYDSTVSGQSIQYVRSDKSSCPVRRTRMVLLPVAGSVSYLMRCVPVYTVFTVSPVAGPWRSAERTRGYADRFGHFCWHRCSSDLAGPGTAVKRTGSPQPMSRFAVPKPTYKRFLS
jgi:hypothetical protein